MPCRLQGSNSLACLVLEEALFRTRLREELADDYTHILRRQPTDLIVLDDFVEQRQGLFRIIAAQVVHLPGNIFDELRKHLVDEQLRAVLVDGSEFGCINPDLLNASKCFRQSLDWNLSVRALISC